MKAKIIPNALLVMSLSYFGSTAIPAVAGWLPSHLPFKQHHKGQAANPKKQEKQHDQRPAPQKQERQHDQPPTPQKQEKQRDQPAASPGSG